jgi:hypothetical protein
MSRTLASLLISLLVVQAVTAAPKGNKGADGKIQKDGWTYVEVGARNTEVGCALRPSRQRC